ncbi:MAG: hypothetical protein ACKO4Q_14440 [Planctomycetota bacterium]
MNLHILSLVTASLASLGLAQSEDSAQPLSHPGAVAPTSTTAPAFLLGSQLAGPIDVQSGITAAPTPGAMWNRLLGGARAWGYYWVSGGAGTGGAFAIHQYDLNGTFLQSFTQDMSQATASQWGVRDFAVDHANFTLWAGMEGRVMKRYTFNPAAGANGTLSFTSTYLLPTGGTFASSATVRSLALDSSGTFYVKNFNSAMWKFTFNGTAFAYAGEYVGNTKASYGIGYDAFTGKLWQFDQNSPLGGTANLVEFNEVDRGTGTLTGRTFLGFAAGTTNLAGGCEVFNDGSGFTKIIGLHQDSVDSLFIYELDPTTTPPVSFCTAGTTTNGCSATMSASGTPSASATSGFTLTVSNVEGQKQGLIFYSITGQQAVTWGNGTSFLCVKSPTQRLLAQNSGGTVAACNGSLTNDWLAFIAVNPTSLGAPLATGQVYQAQGWFRDPPAAKSTSLSNGLEFTLAP